MLKTSGYFSYGLSLSLDFADCLWWYHLTCSCVLYISWMLVVRSIISKCKIWLSVSQPETIQWPLITLLCGVLSGLVPWRLPTSYACSFPQAQSSLTFLQALVPPAIENLYLNIPLFVILFHFLLTQLTLISPPDLSSINTSSGKSFPDPLSDQAGFLLWYSVVFANPASQELVQALWFPGWAQHPVSPFGVCFR